jgi:N-acetylglutamate synthase-like GNAT family acetyltransferase
LISWIMTTVNIKRAKIDDLQTINQIITDCVMGWKLPDRVKRLSLTSYHYNDYDLEHQEIFTAVLDEKDIVGAMALEDADVSGLPANKLGLLLHGIYVTPEHQSAGIGKQLITYAFQLVQEKKLSGLLVKAQPDANTFFKKIGFEKLPVFNEDKDYPHRWWKEMSII